MARRSTPAARRSGSPRLAARLRSLLLLPAVLVVGVAALGSAPAGAQEAPAAPTLTDLLEGSVDGLDATATVATLDGGGLELTVDNDGDEPVEIAVPFGTLVATDVEGDQTLAVGPPDTAAISEVAASGGTPTITVEPGSSTTELAVYCTELEDGFPYEPTEVHPLDPAHDVLADTLRQASAQRSDYTTTQDAVWWLTDEPVLPVGESVAPLLADVDTEAFAAQPFRVVPDTGYDPVWMRSEVTDGGAMTSGPDDEEAAGIIDERFDAGSGSGSSSSSGGSGFALWVVLAGVVAVATVIIATRAGRSGPQMATAPAMAAGWYPDPWGASGHRYWDGRTWTQRTLP